MAGPKIPTSPPPANINPAGTGGGTIRPLYGMFIDTQLNQSRTDVNGTIGVLQQAIDGGQLKGKQAGEAKKAMAALQKALQDLGTPEHPPLNLPVSPPSGGWAGSGAAPVAGGGVARPLYGMFIKDQLTPARQSIGGTIADIQASISGNKITGPDLKEAQNAVKALQTALKDLGTVNTSW